MVVRCSAVQYNHYSLLRTIEDVFGLPHLGDAAMPQVRSFGAFGTEDGQQQPGYRDFAYVAFTIGMCYQVSDTTLRDPQIRRTVLAHAILSCVFGVVIVAGSVNLISGLFR